MWQTNYGNSIAEIGRKKKLWEPNCGNAIGEIGEKKFSNCGNGIVENGGELRNLWKSKKKKVVMSTIFLQHFHNKSHMIVIISSKKFVTN